MDPNSDLPPITSYTSDPFQPMTNSPPYAETQGQLVMVKHSYMLPPPPGAPRSAQSEQPTAGYPHTLDFTTGNVSVDANLGQNQHDNFGQNAAGFDMDSPGSGLTKRKPGRPPKLKSVPGFGVQNQMPNVPAYDGGASAYQPPFQYDAGAGQDLQVNYGPGSDLQGNSGGSGGGGDGGGGSEPLFASLGLSDDGAAAIPSPPPTDNTAVAVKRGRGRPPKSGGGSGGGGGGGQTQGHVAAGGGGGGGGGPTQGQVAGGGQIQGNGTSDSQIQDNVAGDGMQLRKQKKISVMRGKKGRGRPKRMGVGPVTVPLLGNVLRPSGRPKRLVRSNITVNGGVGEMGLSKRRGRPPGNKIANLTGKSFGRPRKGGLGTAVLVTDPRHLVVYQELKTKYELLQSKVKQVASVVKTCIDPEYGNGALGALQELEALAGEVNAPSNAETYEQPTQMLQD
ncbi:uncharacterized protein [Rutidosis leptorrhynchoides]|uniref:uncharacterized protein isoform X2 n=1 Tax=Rutidosis leptorrhynchoides TaxID=125765 RepID=UPI003A99C884